MTEEFPSAEQCNRCSPLARGISFEYNISSFLEKSYVVCTHESTKAHEVIPSKQDSTATNEISGCHPFCKRLREPTLSVANFAHGGYTDQASYLLDISTLHYSAANLAN